MNTALLISLFAVFISIFTVFIALYAARNAKAKAAEQDSSSSFPYDTGSTIAPPSWLPDNGANDAQCEPGDGGWGDGGGDSGSCDSGGSDGGGSSGD